MKKMILFFAASFLAVTMFAQTATPAKKAEDIVKFKELSYNFGKIKQSAPVTHDFVFTNASGNAVVIETATASCGCTTPVWPQAPVAKGKSDKITAGFNAGTAGPFNKTISVKVAGVDGYVVLTITGEVLSAEEFAKYEKTKGTKGK
jgi:Protein of unknown function (DUF1573)